MPLLKLETNLNLSSADKEELMVKLSTKTASLLGKPEAYVMVSVRGGTHLLFAGKTDPCAYVEFKSLGLPEDKTAEFSRELAELLSQETEIGKERVYIEFASPQRHMWGWNGGTF